MKTLILLGVLLLLSSFVTAANAAKVQVTGKVTMPIGFGFDTMTMAGCGMPMRWGAELQYFASHEGRTGLDPEWNFRLYVSPIITAPKWATEGLFGGGCNGCRSCGHRRCCCRR